MKLLVVAVTTIVISMVFNQTTITTEARKLRKTNDQDHFKAGSTDDFASTSPGNSHNVGHRKGNANMVDGFQDDFKPTEGRRLQKTNGQDHFKTGTTDDFAPTSPGHSPGVGHRKENANAERFKDDFKHTKGRRIQQTNGQKHFKTGSMDDFAPTSPGNSPGIGHKKGNANVKILKDDFAPTQDNLKTGSTDDFAPTSPGNSPGMGHKKGDDFKPTTPGHSPGVGHAVKNDEPKA